MTLNKRVMGVAFIVTIAFYAIAYALTTDQIFSAVYISGSQSLRVISVP